MSEYVVEVVDLTKRYGRLVAVDRLSLRVLKGSIHGLLGPNGAGKTTTIKCILGLSIPDSGEVRILGERIKGDLGWRIRERIGYAPEHPRLPEWARVSEILEVYARFYGMRGNDARSRIREVLEEVGLVEKANSRVGELSRGQKQRLTIAQAILHEPEIVVMDEPLIGLDPAGMAEIRSLIASMPSRGSTVLISSHILKELEDLATHVTIIDRGKRLFEGGLDELKAMTKGTLSVRITVGADTPETMSFIKGLPYVERVERIKPSVYRVYFSGGDARAELSRDLASKGIPILEMVLEKESLESAYLKVLGVRGRGR